MSYLDKQYISLSGYDFTPYIHNQDDVDKFERVLYLEERIQDIPVKGCIEQVVELVNLMRDLYGITGKFIYIGKQNPALN